MKNHNICKFIQNPSDGNLQTARFILETALQQGDTLCTARTHRVFLITEGEGRITLNGRSHTLGTGNLVFVVTGTTYTLHNVRNLRYMYIDFAGSRGDGLVLRFRISEHNMVFQGLSWLIPIWKESLLRANEENIDLLSESMLLFAFSQLNAAQTTMDAGAALTDYLNEHFQDSTLTLSSAAAELGYNAKYLSHMFVEKMGIGFSDYLRELRLRQAVLLMNQGLTSVKNISILCGFSDPLYFSKVFKQKFGSSPREFIFSKSDTTTL